MAVYLPVRLRPRIGAAPPIQVVALGNSGYQADREEIGVDATTARELGWWPHLPEQAVPWRYSTAGDTVEVHRLTEAATVQVIVSDRVMEEVVADVVIAPHGRRVLISDALAGGPGG